MTQDQTKTDMQKSTQLPLVSIICEVYNHEPYIRQCLDGFMNQQTNFLFEVLVHDDASIDNSQSIIREYETKYPNIIKPIYQVENKYSKGISIWHNFQCPRAKGKYIALCEGDDYWTDPLKLQKQVDFLEANSDIAVCYTRRIDFLQKENKFSSEPMPTLLNTSLEAIIKYNPIPTLTTVIRKDTLFEYLDEIKPQNRNWAIGDYPIWLWMAIKYKVHGMEDVTAVYRVLSESASHTKNISRKISFSYSFLEIRILYNGLYNLGIDERLLKSKEAYNNIKLCIVSREYKMLFRQLYKWIKDDWRVFFYYKSFKEVIRKKICY